MPVKHSAIKDIFHAVEERQERYWKISDAIWSYAELGLEEYKSSKLLADTFESAGFAIQRGVAGMPTAFVASWSHGSGRPVIGFLAEYDALPHLSQKAGSPCEDSLVPGAPGHGCGHNTIGAMQALTVVSLQALMKKKGLQGTLKYFGSPAEEMLVSRPHLIRAGLFGDVDVVLDCHPWDSFKVHAGVEGMGLFSFVVTFRGKAAHSGTSPWLGRSAGDAVELMHAGTERMREHLPVTQRMHWVTLDGGEAPNVVPAEASTWYFIRDVDENLENQFNWVLDCARGAALMTQTSHEIKILAAVHQRFHNQTLAERIYDHIKRVGRPDYMPEEEAYARELQKNMDLPIKGLDYDLQLTSPEGEAFGGSSDVGDVTLVVPTTGFRFPAYIPGCRPHHWAVTSCAATSVAHKGISAGAKVAVLTALELLTDQTLLKKIKEEFAMLSRDRPYRPFLPREVLPPLGWNAEIMEKYNAQIEKTHLKP